jgi:Lipocalin-like domain
MRWRIAKAHACICSIGRDHGRPLAQAGTTWCERASRRGGLRRIVRLCLPRRPLAPWPRRAKACGMTNRTRQHLLGTWKLIAAVREEIPSGIKTEFLGSTPIGYINYGADGRMLVLTVASERRKPAGSKATSAEVEALFRSMTSYGGTYTIDGNEITHHVDVSWNESWTGTEQKRIARFNGNRVYLSTPPSLDPITGTTSVRTMTWEKLG